MIWDLGMKDRQMIESLPPSFIDHVEFIEAVVLASMNGGDGW